MIKTKQTIQTGTRVGITRGVLALGAALGLLCFPRPVSADVFKRFVDRVVATNADILASEARAKAETLELKAENNLPDPELGFEYQFGQGSLGDKHSFSLSQSFDWPGLYRARTQAARAFEKAMSLNVKADRQALSLRVKLLLTDLVYANRMLAHYKEIYRHLGDLNEGVGKAYDNRQATILDMRKARLELSAAAVKVNEQEARLAEIAGELAALTTDKSLTVPMLDRYPDQPLLAESEYEKYDLENNPSLAAAAGLIGYEEANLKAAKRSSLPGFSIGAVRATELGEHFTGFSVAVSLPFFSGRHKKAAASAKLDAARLDYDNITLTTSTRTMTSLKKIKDIDEKLKPYRDFADDGQYVVLLEKSYNGGQINTLDYINELNYYLSAMGDYEDLLYRRTIELTNLNRYLPDDSVE